ncbi:hypothetical protein R6Q57_022902 [Mikania cordata]
MASKNLTNLSNLLNLDNEIGTGTKPPREKREERSTSRRKNCSTSHSKSHFVPIVNQTHSTVTPEAGSKLNPNCEPYVPTGSLERASSSSISSLSDYDIKPFDPKEFHDKKVTPKAKPTKRPMRTNQSSKPRVKPQKENQNHPTAKRAKPVKPNQSDFHKQKSKITNFGGEYLKNNKKIFSL